MIAARPRRPWDLTPPAERDYFDVLGEGLVVHRSAAGNRAGASGRPPAVDAWIHIGPDSSVRAFTGKADVGQGTRTALSLAVAEEIRVSLARVELVMADTDLCPWDIGTFGSRSMPDALPALRAVSAGARSALLGQAAAAGLGPPSSLEARDGEVRAGGASSGTPYGTLVRGLREVVTVDPSVPLTTGAQWQRMGHPAVDPHAEEVVTGRRTFVSDLRRPGMLHGAVLRPPRYGATPARVELPSVRPGTTSRVLRDGDFVGAVGPSPREARAALSEVSVEWHETAQPDEAESAAVRLEATYRTAYLAHAPLETRAAVAEWDGPRLTVWVGTQTPFRAREYVAGRLGLPLENVRVIVPYTGSGFGGKHGGDVALAAARLSRASGAPVALSYSREEEFRYGYFRPMAIIDLKVALEKDGRIASWAFHNFNAGAAGILPPYRVPHHRVDNELSETPVPQGAYRSLAASTNNFARECAIDELGGRAGLDPLEVREKNLEDNRLLTVLHRATELADWTRWERRPGRGHGMAIGLEKGGRVATVAEVTVSDDRVVKVDRLVTAYEAGAIVHPENLRSQVEGAAVMALGGALFESVHFRAGRVLNPRLSQYRVPRFGDLPRIEVVLVDRKDLPSEGGGETPMIAVAPAIANAIFDACGVRLRSLPLLREGRVPLPGAMADPAAPGPIAGSSDLRRQSARETRARAATP
jgi:nicotinate dehydrogenase subunit B